MSVTSQTSQLDHKTVQALGLLLIAMERSQPVHLVAGEQKDISKRADFAERGRGSTAATSSTGPVHAGQGTTR